MPPANSSTTPAVPSRTLVLRRRAAASRASRARSAGVVRLDSMEPDSAPLYFRPPHSAAAPCTNVLYRTKDGTRMAAKRDLVSMLDVRDDLVGLLELAGKIKNRTKAGEPGKV